MKAIDLARQLYLEYCFRKTFLRDEEKKKLKTSIHQSIVAAIAEAPLRSLFQNGWMFDILKSTLIFKAAESRDLMSIERAFRNLEKYFLLIVQQPWKTEFREIKMYGGFYRTKIKAIIHDCEHIFERAGYMVFPDKCTMIFRGHMDTTFLLILAFDCRLIQIRCRAIAEHYEKMRGFSVTMRDCLSMILSEEYLEDMLAFRSSQKYVKTEGTAAHSNATAPPAVPKREPIISAAMLRSTLKPDQEFILSNDDALMMNARFNLPPIMSYLPSDSELQVFAKPRLSVDVISEPISDMVNDTDEIIPELPEGTCEDHMRESLKLVKQQNIPRAQVSDDWKWVSKNVPAMSSHFPTANPYSVDMMQNFKPDPSRDEGIGMSTFSSYGPPQQILSSRHTNLQQPSFDPGNPESIYSQSSPLSLMQNLKNQTIYLPPNIITDGNIPALPRKTSLSRQSALPIHLPLRALKPAQNTQEEFLFKQPFLPYLAGNTQYPAALQSQLSSEHRTAHPTLSAPEYLPLPRTSDTGYILHRERPAVLKSSSLKVTSKDSPLSEQIATTRLARSMDMTFWECPSCCKLNSSPNVVCSVCSQTYSGTDITLSEYNKTEALF